ncbi:ribonuclease III [Sphingomonas sp.]|uniref:ribonuclease III n=1 Tax=Sphingomonas sp. TaxID=28214 RepID=UPI0017BA489A|nr:ribonuclease III [Sphingomonas sp.]MBA3511409.1 ribonuclease III [Sphingomonas sp.]
MSDLATFVRDKLGHQPNDLALFERALTHPSFGRDHYQRLEFLGDRVLGLVMAEWLSELFPSEPEGLLSHRFTNLVSRAQCALVARDLGLVDYLRLGKQAWDDGGSQSDNILGDVTEGLIGALYLEGGVNAARSFIRRAWAPIVDSQSSAPRHPKSLLHEWAEGHGRKPPTYKVIERTGPPHAPRFTVRASVKGYGEADGEGSSKHEAETAAATALLEQLA